MPRGDGTGPRGEGPRTGRGLGYCAGYDTPGFAKGAPRGGGGFRRGRGVRGCAPRNWTRRAAPPRPTASRQVNLTEEQEREMLEQEKEALENEVDALQKELEEIKKRMGNLQSE